MEIEVRNFYRFVKIDDLDELQAHLQSVCERHSLRGTILLAEEGINANLGGLTSNLDEFFAVIRQDPRFENIQFKSSTGQTRPFSKMKVRIKPNIVIFDPDYPLAIEEIRNGKRMEPEEFLQNFQSHPDDVILLDTRNDYEVEYGSFEGAEHLGIRHFKDFPKAFLERYESHKDKTILMYCTGGIRCEKAVAFAEQQGFKKCYQLEGGIVDYFKKLGGVAWHGSCFVFDFRWSIKPDLQESIEGFALEDAYKGTVHTVPSKAIDDQRHWPIQEDRC